MIFEWRWARITEFDSGEPVSSREDEALEEKLFGQIEAWYTDRRLSRRNPKMGMGMDKDQLDVWHGPSEAARLLGVPGDWFAHKCSQDSPHITPQTRSI